MKDEGLKRQRRNSSKDGRLQKISEDNLKVKKFLVCVEMVRRYMLDLSSVYLLIPVSSLIVWLEITGLPLHAWTTNAFKKVSFVWGEPMFVDEDPNENMATGRVCIKTKVSGVISEVCSVVIQDNTHQVHVKEFAGWSPDIDVASVVSDKVNEFDSTNNESDGNHSKDMQDEEEGEIKENVFDDRQAIQKDQHRADFNPPINDYNHGLMKTSLNKGNRSFKGHSSAFSFIDKKVTKEGKSKSSSKLRSNGSIIEAFISHIEMGNVLGYDMEGSKADLKKFIDGIGANDFQFASLPAEGRSGGIVSVWDPSFFKYVRSVHMEWMLIVEGEGLLNHLKCYMVNIYAPQDDRKKEEMWQIILAFRNENPGSYILFGDFNMDVPLGGHAYTRLSSNGNKLSKLDRFLISEHALLFFQNYNAMVLDSFVSDHRPIILKHALVDFGPVPFKFYNSWLSEPSLDALIKSVWHEPDLSVGASSIISFKDKLKKLKLAIKSWAKYLTEAKCKDKNALISNIKEMKTLLENGNGGTPIYQQRSASLIQL
ncbi:RNA-directed DNA polymerase, eukaryota [Tanacetum coccineum]